MWSRLFFFFFSFSYIRKNNKRATHNTPLNKRGCPPLFLSRKSLFPSITRRPGISSFSRTRKTYNTYTRQQMNFSPTTTIKNRRYVPLTHSRKIYKLWMAAPPCTSSTIFHPMLHHLHLLILQLKKKHTHKGGSTKKWKGGGCFKKRTCNVWHSFDV